MKSHIANEKISIDTISEELKSLAEELDHKHRQQRKIQFLLDVRGYFVANQISGAYVEFGLYRGEMMLSAFHILEKTGCFLHYVGLDTFSGEPVYSEEEQSVNPYLKLGDFKSDFQTTYQFLSGHIGNKLNLINGDFREDEILQKVKKIGPISMGIIDCNVSSSIEAALDSILPLIVPGGFLFMDDLFANVGKGRLLTQELMNHCAMNRQRHLEVYQTYPPCGRAYIIL